MRKAEKRAKNPPATDKAAAVPIPSNTSRWTRIGARFLMGSLCVTGSNAGVSSGPWLEPTARGSFEEEIEFFSVLLDIFDRHWGTVYDLKRLAAPGGESRCAARIGKAGPGFKVANVNLSSADHLSRSQPCQTENMVAWLRSPASDAKVLERTAQACRRLHPDLSKDGSF